MMDILHGTVTLNLVSSSSGGLKVGFFGAVFIVLGIIFYIKKSFKSNKNEYRKITETSDKKDILIRKFEAKEKAKIKAVDLVNEIEKIETQIALFLSEFKKCQSEYITSSSIKKLENEYRALYENVNNNKRKYKSNPKVIFFIKKYDDIQNKVLKHNESFVRSEIDKYKDFLSNIDGKSLDDQQRRAVVTDEDNNLIVAGAGSGKTLTISAKVKYLVEKKDVDPSDILLITYTKNASLEMSERIVERLKIDVDVMTFHKLGIDIISKNNKCRPEVFDEMSGSVSQYFRDNVIGDAEAMKNLVDFFAIYLSVPANLENFECLGDKFDYQKDHDLVTLKKKINPEAAISKSFNQTIVGENVKSIEEVLIANYLYLNGVNYTYEKKYPFDSSDPMKKAYRPDFYLDDYDIYLEHFGITKDKKAPWLSDFEEKKYLDGIEWKRSVHSSNETRLIETYSHNVSKGELYRRIDSELKKHDVEYKSVSYKDIYEKLVDRSNERQMKDFRKLIETFISLFKSNGYNEDTFKKFIEKNKNNPIRFLRERNECFFKLVKPIYMNYENKLHEDSKIDFNDMIINATKLVKSTEAIRNYKYIIIDEFQDISMSRLNLVKAIKEKTGAKVIAVGDDWQSIYKFAGSDVNLFTKFEKYMGFTKELKLEATYRNSQELVDVAGNFVMSNPNQIKKNLISSLNLENPVKIYGYNKSYVEIIIKAIDDIVKAEGEDTDILVLGRNGYDMDVVKSSKLFIKKNVQGVEKYTYTEYPDVSITYMTVHKSKGMEASNVIVINLVNKITGFPNKIADDSILKFVLSDDEIAVDKKGHNINFVEERRLFYVALTRTKNRTYLIVDDNKKSVFVDELIRKQGIKYEMLDSKAVINKGISCPHCKTGYLVLRKKRSDNSKFIGCSNYPQCSQNYSKKYTEIIKYKKVCKVCGDYMIKRSSKNGDFFGCVNYFGDNKCKGTDSFDKNLYLEVLDIEKSSNYVN